MIGTGAFLRLRGPAIAGRTGNRTEATTTHALILAHGDPPSALLLDRLRADAELFIATDGAANDLRRRGIRPDVVLGDFDSIDAATREALDAALVDAYDQEASDLEKAVLYALSRGATQITLAGAAGGRLDHTLVAISVLMRYADSARIRLRHDGIEVRAVWGEEVLTGAPGDTLSLVVFGEAHRVDLNGTLYPLRGETLYPGSRGVSNTFASREVRVRLESGKLIVCHLMRVDPLTIPYGDGRDGSGSDIR